MRVSLEILLQSGEGQYVEYKSCFDRPKHKQPKPRPLRTIAKEVAICLAEMANADGGTVEQKLREYFSRHVSMKNADYRLMAGKVHRLTALQQLKELEKKGLLRREGKGKGTRYFATEELLRNS